MSQKAVEQLIGRMITDERFREKAARELELVCMEEGYRLTDGERRIVATLDLGLLARLEKYWLDDRIKRSAPYV